MNNVNDILQSLSFVEEFVQSFSGLVSETDIDQLLQKNLSVLRQFTNCDGGRVYLLDTSKKYLQLRLAQWLGNPELVADWYKPRDLQYYEESLCRDPLKYCCRSGTIVDIRNIYQSGSFDLDYILDHDSVNQVYSYNMLLVPLMDHERNTIGVLELINARHSNSKQWAQFQPIVGIVNAFASQLAVCINNLLLIEANKSLIAILNQTNKKLARENKHLRLNSPPVREYQIIGESPAIDSVLKLLDKAVDTRVSILITGETGTGKEVIARAIHNNSSRRNGQFISQNCAALPEQLLESELFGYCKGAFTGAVNDKKGLFELADGGTLFLDEIGDMPIGLQSKLLRVLQEGEIRPLGSTRMIKVDVRILAATHCDLQECIAQGSFREDLYFRLNVFPIHLPPLRERGNDIGLLVHHFVNLFSKRYQRDIKGISPSALELLFDYAYPGNIRELQNIVERAVLLCDSNGYLMPEHLSGIVAAQRKHDTDNRVSVIDKVLSINSNYSLKSAVSEYEASVIIKFLRANNWNQTKTASVLRIPRRTLIDKMNRLNISLPRYENRG